LPNTPAGDRNDVPAIALPTQANQTTEEWQNSVHAYFAEVTGMDAQLGLILDEMDRQGLWENTVVVLWSDHGQHLGEHEGTWLKNTLFQESDRAPLIVCVPGKQPGTTKALVELVDIYPSLAEICGLPAPTGMEGSSFVRLIDNVKTPWKRASFTQVVRYDTVNEYAVVTKQFRYNSWGTDGEELYDHAADPFEYTNLATNPAYVSVLQKMRKILAQGWKRSLPPPPATAKSTDLNSESISANSLQKNVDVPAIKVYPNPSYGGRVFVEFKSSYAENVQVTIYNSEGKAVLKTLTETRPGSNQLSFRLAHFATGVYNIELKSNSIKQNVKFVIEK
jgi:iduronate 2-sulfatase